MTTATATATFSTAIAPGRIIEGWIHISDTLVVSNCGRFVLELVGSDWVARCDIKGGVLVLPWQISYVLNQVQAECEKWAFRNTLRPMMEAIDALAVQECQDESELAVFRALAPEWEGSYWELIEVAYHTTQGEDAEQVEDSIETLLANSEMTHSLLSSEWHGSLSSLAFTVSALSQAA